MEFEERRLSLANVPTGSPSRAFDALAKDDGVVQVQVPGPDEFRSVEIGFAKGSAGSNDALSIFGCLLPTGVVEVDGVPIVWNVEVLHTGIVFVAVDRAIEEIFGLPRGVGDDIGSDFQDKSAVPDIAVVIFESGFRIAAIFGHCGDGHRVFGQNIYRDYVVRHEIDGIHSHQLAVDVEFEPIVRVDIHGYRVGQSRLDDAFRCIRPSSVLGEGR